MHRNGSSHHMTNGNGVLTIHSNGSHVNGDQANNHVFYEKSPIINGYVDKRNGTNSNGIHHLQQQSPPQQAVQQQTPTPQATNSRRRTISSNSNG